MRPIKFRAWDKWSNRWIKYEFGAPPVIDFGGYLRKTHANLSYTELGGTWKGDSSSYVLMQYTGLEDYRGVEIYEGDIVAYETSQSTTRGVVEYGSGLYGLVHAGIWFHMWDMHLDSAEVIGNIYENPELLEANQ